MGILEVMLCGTDVTPGYYASGRWGHFWVGVYGCFMSLK